MNNLTEPKRYLTLNDIECYKTSFRLSNYVWKIVMRWNQMAKNTVGEQLIRATDSISANIAEGFGRYGKKDKIRFYRISQASVIESLDWNEKSKHRELMSIEEYDHIYSELKKIPRSINVLIKYTNDKLAL